MRKILLSVFLLSFFTQVNAQSAAQLNFTAARLVTGTAGANGAQYRFSHVTPDLDAVVTLVNRSSTNVTLTAIDRSDIGVNANFQPELGISGSVSRNSSWWMEFKITFLQAASTLRPLVNSFSMTAIDVDGDGGSLNETVVAYSAQAATTYSPTLLTGSATAVAGSSDYNFTVNGPVTTKNNIDPNATDVMVVFSYVNKNEITVRLGGRTNNSSASTSGVRLNSLWFRTISYQLLEQSVLPVTLTSFTAESRNNTGLLKWATATEDNFKAFVVERSQDGRTYTSIATINGTNAQGGSYLYTDTSVTAATTWYRLRMVDTDGAYTYSAVRIIRAQSGSPASITLFPNPATDAVRVTLPAAWQNKKVVLELYTATGKRLKALAIASASQTETVALQNLATGIYIIKATMNGASVQQTLLKN